MIRVGTAAAWVAVGGICGGLTWVVVATSLGFLAIPALLLLWASLAHPYPTALVLGFLATAVPKAGVKFGDFPFPVMLFGLALGLLLLGRVAHSGVRRPASDSVLMLGIGYAMLLAHRIDDYADSGPATVAAFLAWSAGPVVLLAVATRLHGVPATFRRSIEYGFLASVGYAFLQLLTSVEAVAIPGLTYALGDSLDAKNNALDAELSKIPSTYQSGNTYGLVAAMFAALALQRIVRREGTRLDLCVALAGATVVAVSGSRTAVAALAIAGAVLFVSRGTVTRKVVTVAAAVTAFVIAVLVNPGLLNRYSIDSALASGAAGRTTQWELAIARFSWQEWLFGSQDRSFVPEGWAGVGTQLGALGVLLLALLVLALIRARPGYGLGFVVLALGAAADSSYQVFPTWFLLPAAMAVLGQGAVDPARRRPDSAPPSSDDVVRNGVGA